ncbi:adenylyl-sulfate kinase [Sciscionella sediminilitoris]|uniref:adenylyl-sulfate kinase n=1 Tax=Sciscionella sediminilitoris TaxID=1445613 RepID=UPI0004DF8AC1|nr:adenylyl-sulfate kinase [Sciscionella sp. SE31]
MDSCAVLLLGGRSGAGKSSVAVEVSTRLRDRGVAHCLLEGGTLDQVHPAPPGDPDRALITERNLAAIWRNYAELGHRKLVYCNTASLLDAPMFLRVLGESARLIPVLLTASDATVGERLAGREIGSGLEEHLRRSAAAARELDRTVPAETVRIPTGGSTVSWIAERAIAATGW